ncbi:hypothetical protein ENTCAN_05528 [Enterobacter cancerogenus ATCC 35316]|nr:hypothetical protein ENTCAN_05528 [Enterobacter cancerogenus ATCC 35316]
MKLLSVPYPAGSTSDILSDSLTASFKVLQPKKRYNHFALIISKGNAGLCVPF